MPAGADLDELRAAADGCRGCELWEPATQTVFSAGPPDARVVLVGEQPGDQSRTSRAQPFVGPAGRLLVKAVDEAGIDRDVTYRTNAVKHFRFTQAGPGKRRIHQTPEMRHIDGCRPWLVEELRISTRWSSSASGPPRRRRCSARPSGSPRTAARLDRSGTPAWVRGSSW